MEFFALSWHSDDDNNIRIYGIEKGDSRPSMVQIPNYNSTIYIELDERIIWNNFKIEKLVGEISKRLNGTRPTRFKKVLKRKLMGASVNSDGGFRQFEFLEMQFELRKTTYFVTSICQDQGVDLGNGRIRLPVHHQWIDLWYQFALYKNLPICDWIMIKDAVLVCDSKKQSICDKEYIIDAEKCFAMENSPPPPAIPLLAYDIEAYSSNPRRMPQSNLEEDQVFQISMVQDDHMILITRGKINLAALQKRFAKKQVRVYEVNSEMMILKTFVNVLHELQPMIIMGYNNMQFDAPFMIEKAKTFANCWTIFERQSMNIRHNAVEKELSWSSAAMSDQRFTYMKGEGFASVDVLSVIRADYKLGSYTLNNVSEHFLKNKKDDVSHLKVFEAYDLMMKDPDSKEAINAMTTVGAYCLQDSQLVLDLFDNLKLCSALIAMSFVTNCRLEDLNVRGAQHKVVSNIVRYCHNNGVIINKPKKNSIDAATSYRGATVFEPELGLHEFLVSFDFKSLYPSLIRASNLCASTLVASNDTSIPDKFCKTLEWEDHVRCEHDIQWQEVEKIRKECDELKKRSSKDPEAWRLYVDKLQEKNSICRYKPGRYFCQKRKFRWIQSYQGVYPSILEKLLNDRAKVRKDLKLKTKELSEYSGTEDRIKYENQCIALNALQLAIKKLANSLYGFTGSSSSPIPCVAIAMCTTYMGRKVIKEASEIIRDKFGGHTVYGDTDSNYVKFPHIQNYDELYSLSLKVSKYVSDQFHKHLDIEFEGDVFRSWLIMGKKQYCYTTMNPDGSVKPKVGAKGLLLVRRDNSDWVREVYKDFVNLVFCHTPIDKLLDFVLEKSLELLTRVCNDKKMVITKSVGSWGNGDAIIDDVGKTRMGKYIVPKLPNDKEEVEKILSLKGFKTPQDFYSAALPAHVKLAQRENNRGVLVVPGERLQYVVTGERSFGEPMGDRLESFAWYMNNRDVIRIDYLHYINILATAVDTVLYAVMYSKQKSCNSFTKKKYFCKCNGSKKCLFCKLKSQLVMEKQKGFMNSIVSQMSRKVKLMEELTSLFRPRIITG